MSNEPEEPEASEEKPAKASVPWVALILILLVVPIVTIAVMQFVVIPKLVESLPAGEAISNDSATDYVPVADAADHAGDGHEDEGAAGVAGNRMVFEELVTNLANTKGSRFLRVSFEVLSRDHSLSSRVASKKSQVHDALITVLGNQTIEDIEGTGGRNKLRVGLISAINTALGQGIVEELYFLDLIIQ